MSRAPAIDGSGTYWRDLFRRAFLALAVVGVAGTAVELAMLRHWHSAVEVIPWIALGVLSVAIIAVAARPRRGTVRMARWIAGVVAACAVFGVIQHVTANHAAGPLDFRYTARWGGMPRTSQWWAALTQSVGPSPTLAPLILAQTAACLWLATLATAQDPPTRNPGSESRSRCRRIWRRCGPPRRQRW